MPKPQMNGYGIQPVDRRIKTDMEMGGVYRAEFDTDENECSCSLVLNRDESAWFEVFERDLLKQGTVWFEMPLWVGGKVETHVVRMKERPKAGNLIGLHTTYTLSLDVRKRNIPMCPGVAALLTCYTPSSLGKIMDMFSALVDETAPGITILPRI